jgi:hypothetical protein
VRTLIPGYRFFRCDEEDGCKHEWKEACRDARTPSISSCPKCNEVASPHDYEEHPEWPTENGNLIRGHDYGAEQ